MKTMQTADTSKSTPTKEELISELWDIQQFLDDADFEYMRGNMLHVELVEFKQRLEKRATDITQILEWKLVS